MTKTELKELNNLLKEIPTDKRQTVRRTIDKDISFDDAKTIINAFLPPTAENIQVLTVNNSNIQDNNVLERVQGEELTNLDILSIQASISDLIRSYSLQIGYNDDTDLIKAPQRVWGAVCSFIGDNLIRDIVKPMNRLKTKRGQIITDNTVDIHKLAECLKLYTKLCDKYNKAVLIDHAANFAGLSRAYVFNVRDKLTPLGIDLWKKREDSIISGMLDGKSANVTGCAILLNHDYGYATNTTHTEKKETIVIYPTLTNTATQNTITEK